MSGHRVIPAEKHPQQPEEKQGDPVLNQLACPVPRGSPHTCSPQSHGCWGLPAVPCPGSTATSRHRQRGTDSKGVAEVEGYKGKGEAHHLKQRWGESLVGSAGGGGVGNGQLDALRPRQGSVPISLQVGPCAAKAPLWKQTSA